MTLHSLGHGDQRFRERGDHNDRAPFRPPVRADRLHRRQLRHRIYALRHSHYILRRKTRFFEAKVTRNICFVCFVPIHHGCLPFQVHRMGNDFDGLRIASLLPTSLSDGPLRIRSEQRDLGWRRGRPLPRSAGRGRRLRRVQTIQLPVLLHLWPDSARIWSRTSHNSGDNVAERKCEEEDGAAIHWDIPGATESILKQQQNKF